MPMFKGPVTRTLLHLRRIAPAALVTTILALTVPAAAPAADEEASAMQAWQAG